MQTKSSTNILGIDVSHHNGQILWGNVAKDNVKFAFIKATQGTGFIDDQFINNFKGAKSVGIKVGFYHYAVFTTEAQAKAEALYFAKQVNGYDVDLPHVLDLEDGVCQKLDVATLSKLAVLWLETVKQATNKPVMLYTGAYFARDQLNSTLGKYPLWIAQYSGTKPMDNSTWSKWNIWQYNDNATIQGIAGNVVDMNVMELDFWNQLFGNSNPTPTPVTTPTPVVPVSGNYKYNTVYKERIYSSNGKIVRCDGDYKTTASDIRLIKFDKNATKLEFVYQKGAKVSDIVKAKKAFAATNGPFFANGQILGNCKIGTQVISQAYGKTLKWHSLIYKDGKLSVGIYDINEPCDFMIQCSPPLVENGVNVVDKYVAIDQTAPDIAHSYCQRTFIGIDNNNDIIAFVGDGRTSSDKGLSLNECALYAISKNCHTAFAMDGGSSSILATNEGGLNQKLNTGVNERAVNHALLFYVNANNNGGGNVDTSKITPVHIDLVDSTHNAMNSIDGILVDGKPFIQLDKIADFYGSKYDFDDINKSASLVK